MQLTHKEALDWLKSYSTDLESALAKTANNLVIFPSFTELAASVRYKSDHISFGAQDCGFFERGAYTGDVSVLTLKQLACTHTLIGHSERRSYYCETNDLIAQKALLLIKHGIEPVFCIGETAKERNNGITHQILEYQLAPLLQAMRKHALSKISIAYEPVWAIGTQQLPRAQEISQTFNYIRALVRGFIEQPSLMLFYGGSVNERSIGDLGLSMADGFLLGKASIDHEVLKKIILSC